MKCRVFKKPDGRVIYAWPTRKYQHDFSLAKFPPETEGLLFVDLDESELPDETGRDWYSHGPLTMVGDCAKENLRFDEGWDIHLMPCEVLRRKHIVRLNDKIEDGLKKAATPEALIALQLEKDRCKYWSEKELYESALQSLDERVAGGETDKPTIREKLTAKIEAL